MYTARLRHGERHGHLGLRFIQPQQAGTGGGGRNRAQRRALPALLEQRSGEAQSEFAHHFEPGDKGGQHLGAGGPDVLAKRQQGGGDVDGHMARHRVVHIVVIQHMPRRAVDKCGQRGRHGTALPDQSGAGGGRFCLGVTGQHWHGFDARPGHGHRVPVEQREAGSAPGAFRHVFQPKGDNRGGKRRSHTF